jgi:xanthine dehydrogenase accessory factor
VNNPELWVLLRESLKKSVPCALLLTLKTEGSGPGRPGAAMAVISGGTSSGTIGGGMEQGMIRHALLMLEQGKTSPSNLLFSMKGNFSREILFFPANGLRFLL